MLLAARGHRAEGFEGAKGAEGHGFGEPHLVLHISEGLNQHPWAGSSPRRAALRHRPRRLRRAPGVSHFTAVTQPSTLRSLLNRQSHLQLTMAPRPHGPTLVGVAVQVRDGALHCRVVRVCSRFDG